MKSIVTGLGFALLCLIFTAQSNAAIDANTIEGLWLFDDGSGNTASDSSGNGRHGDIMGGTQWIAGRYGGALNLNGTDGEVVITGYKGIGGTAGRSTVLWFRGTAERDHRLVCWGANAEAIKYHIRVHESAPYSLRVETQGGQLYSNGPTLVDGEWHHVAVVLPDGSTMCHDNILYIDGILQEDRAGNDVGLDTDNVTWDVEIGYDKDIGHGEYAEGDFDEVGIFNVALSVDDVNMIMMQGFAQVVLGVSSRDKLATTWSSLKISN